MLTVGLVSYAAGTLAALVLALVLLTGKAGGVRKHLLMFAAAASALWMGISAAHSAGHAHFYATLITELLRDFAWLIFLGGVLTALITERDRARRRFRNLAMLSGGYLLLVASATTYRFAGGEVFHLGLGMDWLLAGYLVVPIGGLVLVEQVFRNTRVDARRGIKYLCIGTGSLFAYDFYLYSNALLFQGIDPNLWQARGLVNAVAIPVVAVAVLRDPRWSVDIFVSRRIVFHTAALLGAGVYLLAMGVGGYYVRNFGGTWGAVGQVIFFFGAIVVLAVLFLSGPVRASLRVFINKHFFHYKYDYRDEWLRFIATLSQREADEALEPRVVQAIADIISSPAGVLWWRRDGAFRPVASWHAEYASLPAVQAEDSLPRFLDDQEWVINLEEYRKDPGFYTNLHLPDWMLAFPRAWLITPLILHDELLGFVLLARPHGQHQFNWEDCDLLKTVGREAASHLAQYEASRALAEARQFETYNRLSTYVIHDLKNLIGQLSLLVTNAEKHKHNPAFMEDAIQTVDNSVTKMNRLLAHLRSGDAAEQQREQVDLCPLLEEVAITMANGHPAPSVDCQARGIHVSANRERLGAVIGHVVRNAQDATPPDGKVIIRLFKHNDMAVIEVQDTGAGMDEAFIREHLFKPFETTKGQAGMGVGAHEARDFIRNLGGEVEVISRVGEGTSFRMRVPISEEIRNRIELQLIDNNRTPNDGRIQEASGR